jgi:hypothetical protein
MTTMFSTAISTPQIKHFDDDPNHINATTTTNNEVHRQLKKKREIHVTFRNSRRDVVVFDVFLRSSIFIIG